MRYSSWVSRNPNLFEYMSFWAHDKTAQIPLQSMQTWYFFQMMHFIWSRVYNIESLGISFNSAVFQVIFLKDCISKYQINWKGKPIFRDHVRGKFIFHCFPELTCTQTVLKTCGILPVVLRARNPENQIALAKRKQH